MQVKANEGDRQKNGRQMPKENLKIGETRGAFEARYAMFRRLTLIDVKLETVSQLKPRNRNCCAGIRHNFVVDDETHAVVICTRHSSLEEPRMRISSK